MIGAVLGLTGWLAAAWVVAVSLGRGISRADRFARLDAAQAWDHGFSHGVRTARDAVRNYRKPWITMSEERGWDLAREQLVTELETLLDEDERTGAGE